MGAAPAVAGPRPAAGEPPARWRLRPPAPPVAAAALGAALGVPVGLAAILHARGVRAAGALEPPLALHENPALREAAGRIVRAVEAGRRIRVHGDYDADGVTASSLLVLGLGELGAKVHAYIPNRLTDGYGIHPERVGEHAAACDLLLTVDCGVSNLDEVARLVEGGLEVIVTDHHAPGRALPGCLVVHPHLSPTYVAGGPALAGAGVAYHLLWAVREAVGLGPPVEYADLAAIGTIADVAALLGENRALARLGLAVMADSRWPGVRAALEAKGLAGRALTARDVSHVVGPLINAAGRMGDAEGALELLTTTDPGRARDLAGHLERRNAERRRVQDRMLAEALAAVDASAPAIVVAGAGWHRGVAGVVAMNLMERHGKPAFVVADGTGSARSTPGISAVGALRHATDHLARFGGHAEAAGFAVREGALEGFREAVFDFVNRHEAPSKTIVLDAILAPDEATPELRRRLAALEPFGKGHEEPVFLVRDRLAGVRAMGQAGQHLRYRLGGRGAKSWSTSGYANGDLVDAAARLVDNEYGGRVSLEFHGDALRYAAPLALLGPGDGGPLYPRLETRAALARLGAAPAPVYAEGGSLAHLGKFHPTLPVHSAPEPPDGEGALTLIAMPEPELLGAWVAAGARLEFALTERTLGELEGRPFWTLERLRAARRRQERGEELPPRALGLLAVLDPDDPAAQRHPALAAEEAEAYRLAGFCRHYRLADDEGFSRAVRLLYGPAQSEAGS